MVRRTRSQRPERPAAAAQGLLGGHCRQRLREALLPSPVADRLDRRISAEGTGDDEVRLDGPKHLAIRRHFIQERYKLLPYLYSVAE